MAWWSKWLKPWLTSQRTTPEVDYNLGGRLVGHLSAIFRSPSVDALRNLPKACDPSSDENTIDIEIFFFHNFLVVQTCAGFFPQGVVNWSVAAFYKALEVVLTEDDDTKAQPYVAQFIRRRMATTNYTLAVLDKVWRIRAGNYEEPFQLDVQELSDEEFLKKHPMHISFKRMILQFSQKFRQTSDAAKGFDALPLEAVGACIAVAAVFGVAFKSIGEELRTSIGKRS